MTTRAYLVPNLGDDNLAVIVETNAQVEGHPGAHRLLVAAVRGRRRRRLQTVHNNNSNHCQSSSHNHTAARHVTIHHDKT